ncbi:MAG: redox-sensing transcriptional repressor Rex [Dehalococcoidia bacterium]
MQRQIPEVVVSRLPMYVRGLAELHQDGIDFINSQDLGHRFGMSPDQIRKDLSYFGKFGRQGRGYNVALLLSELRQILGLDRQWCMAIVGVGRLGRAIMDYKGFVPRGFKIVAAFDKERNVIGKRVSGVVIQDMAELETAIREKKVDIAVVAVPSTEAQEVIDKLVRSGIKSILNYAPVYAYVPKDVRLEAIDPVLALQSMTYYLARSQDYR